MRPLIRGLVVGALALLGTGAPLAHAAAQRVTPSVRVLSARDAVPPALRLGRGAHRGRRVARSAALGAATGAVAGALVGWYRDAQTECVDASGPCPSTNSSALTFGLGGAAVGALVGAVIGLFR